MTALRLALALLVIFSHGYEIQNLKDPLEAHGLPSFGAFAVDAFFVLSGYVVSLSYLQRPKGYLIRRAARIYPAFLVCCAVCIAIGWNQIDRSHTILRMFLLKDPETHAGGYLNGSMWTIIYEARCYVLVMLLGLFGALGRWRTMLALGALCVVASPLVPDGPQWVWGALGYLSKTVRLTGWFLLGVAWRGTGLLKPPGQAKNTIDISYGVYLWGWPISAVLLDGMGMRDPGTLAISSGALACVFGAASWFVIEKPAIAWAKEVTARKVEEPYVAPRASVWAWDQKSFRRPRLVFKAR